MAVKLGSIVLDLSTNTAKFDKGINRSKKLVDGLGGSANKLKVAFAGLGAGLVLGSIVRTIVEFEKLEASLLTVTGSAEKAKLAFDKIKAFAKTTPFQITEITSAFIKMKALGLDPSEAALRSYGDTASAMGKSLNQIVEAVADAATGEFERLKEFGIKSKSQGDKVTFTFNNVATTVGKNAKEIESFLRSIGETKFAGGMKRQMDTLGGSFSNLQDTASLLADEIGKAGLSDIIRSLTDSLIALAPAVSAVITEFRDLQKDAEAAGIALFKFISPDVKTELDLINERIANTREEIKKQQAIMNRNDLSVYNTSMVNAAGIEIQKLNDKLIIQERLLTRITDSPAISKILSKKPSGAAANDSDFAQAQDQILGSNASLIKKSDERLETLRQSLLTETQVILEELQKRKDVIDNAEVLGIGTEEERNNLLLLATEDYESKKTEITKKGVAERERVLSGQLGAAASIFSSLSSLAGREGKKQTALQKTLARASIITSTAQAVMNALATPPYPLGVALATAAALKGAEQLSKVGGGGGSSTSIGGLTQASAGVDIGAPSGLINPSSQTATQIVFTGDMLGEDLSERLIEIIRTATNDRDVIVFDSDSRQAQEVREAS